MMTNSSPSNWQSLTPMLVFTFPQFKKQLLRLLLEIPCGFTTSIIIAIIFSNLISHFKKGQYMHTNCAIYFLDVPPTAFFFVPCPSKYDGKHREIANFIGEMWTNFAIKGDPSPNSIVWPKFTSISNASAMTIRSNLTIEPTFFLDVADFWNVVKPKVEQAFARRDKERSL